MMVTYIKSVTVKLRKTKEPCQAVSNKLSVEWLPRGFGNLKELEIVLVARGILFKKVAVMPKGQSPMGSICNFPFFLI